MIVIVPTLIQCKAERRQQLLKPHYFDGTSVAQHYDVVIDSLSRLLYYILMTGEIK
jgi:hypothetical protein